MLVGGEQHGLADLRIVEGRIEPVHSRHAAEGERVQVLDLDARYTLQHRNEVVRRLLDVINLAIDQGVHGGLIVCDVEPFDPIDLDDFTAREPARRFGARLIVRVFLSRPP